MEKILNSYETLFVVDCSIGEEGVKSVVDKFTALIAENGTVENVESDGSHGSGIRFTHIPRRYFLYQFNSKYGRA